MIGRLVNDNEVETTSRWDEVVNRSAIKRLLRFNEDEELITKLMGISMPNVILNCSDAVLHEIESRINKFWKTLNDDEKQAEKDRIHELIRDYMVVIEYVKIFEDPEENVDRGEMDLEAKINRYYLREAEIRNKIQMSIENTEVQVQALCEKAIRQNSNIVSENTLSIEALIGLLSEYRKMIGDNKRREKEIEMVHEVLRDIRETGDKRVKRGPGRPRTKPGSSQRAKNKSITDFYKKSN